jgi:hypothetical protein
MTIIVENLEVKPEATSSSVSAQQAPPPPPARLNPTEVEKALRRMLERLERLQAS